MIASRRSQINKIFFSVFLFALLVVPRAAAQEVDLKALRDQIAAQREQISRLQAALSAQSQLIDKLLARSAGQPVGETARAAAPAAQPAPASALAPAPAGAQNVVRIEDLAKSSAATAKNLGGFRFSGDFRYRLDAQVRSGNEFASPLQNIRSRYRFRLNIDKDIDPRFSAHVQLSTGPYTTATTNDQDMGAMASKHPISIAEAFVDFHPNSKFSLRGGRMEEVFADNMRFIWDDDVRFNGFQQILRLPIGSNSLGFKSLEFRAGEYILSNPAVYILSPTSPYTSAGYKAGQKVRDAALFHPGFILKGDVGSAWSQQIYGSMQLYHNANQIQLASSAAGVGAITNSALGISLPSGFSASGNATTTPGGAIYSAPHWQIARLGYRLDRKGLRIGNREMPAYFDFQGSRNVGTSRLRDAYAISANLGAVRGFGDMRFLYQFAVKDASSMISQFTDDDLGTGTGVNIRVHAIRFDLGLTRFLSWQNLLFIQDPRAANDPAHRIYVPIPLGANTTFRYLGQLAFAF